MVEEVPFRPREKLIEKQRLYQSIHKHTYLKGPMDKITSVAIPLAFAGSSLIPSFSSDGVFTTCLMGLERKSKYPPSSSSSSSS